MMFKEIGLLKNLNHKNIIKVRNCYTLKHEMKLAIVLEYLEGGDLRQFLDKQEGQYVDEETARKIFLQLFAAIQYCHREKIIHRDLKLENIMFSDKNQDTIKVVDFGISGTQSLISIDYTQAGSVRYFAPEVLSTKAPAHPSIDIWAMGCILFWILVGHSPFPQNTREEVFNNILKGTYQIPEQAKARMTKSVQELIDKMLQVDINKRITMAEMAQHQWLRSSVEYIKELERKEKLEQQQMIRSQKMNHTQRRSIKNGTKSTQRIQIGCNSWICNVQPGSNKIEFLRKVEGTKLQANPQPNIQKNSLVQALPEKQIVEEISQQKQETQKQQMNQKKQLPQKILPYIQENINSSNNKKIQSQRLLKQNQEKAQNQSTFESNILNQNAQNQGTSFAGILTPKQLNSPNPLPFHKNSLSNLQSTKQTMNKTPNYQNKESNNVINENNYIVNKTYASQTNLQQRLSITSIATNNNNNNNSNTNSTLQQNEYLLNVNSYFSNVMPSQKKLTTDKISPLQSPHSNKSKPFSSLKDIPPAFLRKNENKFSQQKLIQITCNTQQVPCEGEGNQNKASFINNLSNNPPKHRHSHLVAPSSRQGGLDQDISTDNQQARVQIQKRTHTLL